MLFVFTEGGPATCRQDSFTLRVVQQITDLARTLKADAAWAISGAGGELLFWFLKISLSLAGQPWARISSYWLGRVWVFWKDKI